MSIKLGDRVSIRLDINKVVSPYAPDYNDTKTFDVIGIDYSADRYCLFCPHFLDINGNIKINKYNYKQYCVNEKYIGENILYLSDTYFFNVVSVFDGGCFCSNCGEYNEYAVKNNGGYSYTCFKCRNT